MAGITGIFNTSAYDGTIDSDFINIGDISLKAKSSKVDYSINDFAEYRESLITYLRAVYPNDYNNFVDSDLGVTITTYWNRIKRSR